MEKLSEDACDDSVNHDDLMVDAGARIINSLRKHSYQTWRHLCVNTGLSIGTIIDWLDGNGDEVPGEQVGNIWVYYLRENTPSRLTKPKKLYFGGKVARTIMLRDDPQRGNTGAMSVGDKVVLNLRPPDPQEKKLYLRNLPPLVEEEIERLAAIKPDMNFIADELDVNSSRFKYEIIHQENLKRAFERGKTIYMNNQKNAAEPIKSTSESTRQTEPQGSASESIKPLPLAKRLTPAVVEEAASRGETTTELGIRLGVSGKYPGKQIENFVCSSKYPELRAAWKRGKALRAQQLGKSKPGRAKTPVKTKKKSAAPDFVIPEKTPVIAKEPIQLPEPSPIVEKENSDLSPVENAEPEISESEFVLSENGEADARFQNTIQHIGRNGHSREKFEVIQGALTKFEMPNFQELKIGKIPVFSGLSVKFDGDFFSLPEKQRRLLCEMAALNDEFYAD